MKSMFKISKFAHRANRWLFRKTEEYKRAKRQRSQRSVVFLHNAYYNFYYLAAALRKRGWNAIVVSVESPKSPDYRFFHGEDINLWDENRSKYEKNVRRFVERVKREFNMLHFYSGGRASFFDRFWESDALQAKIPFDFIDLKKAGVKIGYTHSGCLDLVSQTTFHVWSGGVCNKCIWQDRPDVCSDIRNLSWGHKVQMLCDLICIETEPVMDYKSGPKVFREPLTFAIDPTVWSDQLEIPEKFKIERNPDEVVVYHSFANYDYRQDDKKNIKGTPAVLRAIEKLQEDGIKIRLHFVTNVHSKDVRFIQAQCDIIVDQINYGRYGATAREGMMLGKPVVGRIKSHELREGLESQCILETPIVNADESTIESVLRDLALNPEKRKRIGEASRAHAIKWWSSDVLAERYETVYDRLMAGQAVSDIPIMDFIGGKQLSEK